MHNVGATQQIYRESSVMKSNIQKVEDESAAVIVEMARINGYLEEQAAKKEADLKQAAEQEAQRKAAHIAKASQVSLFGPDGQFVASPEFEFADQTLTTPKVQATEVITQTLGVLGQTELDGDAHIAGSLTVTGSVMGSGPYTDSSGTVWHTKMYSRAFFLLIHPNSQIDVSRKTSRILSRHRALLANCRV